jgi:hypothetical protein
MSTKTTTFTAGTCALLSSLALAACSDHVTGTDGSPDVAAAVATITTEDVMRRIEDLAHDSLDGRDSPSPGLESSALYLAAAFESAGLQPAAPDGTWYQRFTIGKAGSPMVPNVIGWLEGSDPDLQDEYLVFVAHFDHVGNSGAVTGDAIYNGADDNASGTAGLVELAEAFGRLERRPRRSIVIMAVSGEEKGLLGSRHYVDHATFPISATVAALNMDMIGRNWTDRIVAIRSPGSIGPTAERVASEHPELDMLVLEDPWPSQNLLLRSDQYSFLLKGIPVLFFTSGLHEDYHQPTDEADRIDGEKTARVVKLVFYVGLELADADERPN